MNMLAILYQIVSRTIERREEVPNHHVRPNRIEENKIPCEFYQFLVVLSKRNASFYNQVVPSQICVVLFISTRTLRAILHLVHPNNSQRCPNRDRQSICYNKKEVSLKSSNAMGTRIKLRVCTWNVGNAQPPADLKQWLGIGEDDYDLIVIGAQEANFGSDKSTTPGPQPVSPVISPTTVKTIEGMDFAPMSPCTPATPVTSSTPATPTIPPTSAKSSAQGSSSCFRRLGNVLSGFSKTSSSRRRSKKLENGQENVKERSEYFPKTSTSFPLTGNRDFPEELNRSQSHDGGHIRYIENPDVPVVSLRNFTETGSVKIAGTPRSSQFGNLDGSLLNRQKQISDDNENSALLKRSSVNDPVGKIFSSEGSLNEESQTQRDNLILEGLEELCVEDGGPATVAAVCETPQQHRSSQKFRRSQGKGRRVGEDNTEANKGGENEDTGMNMVSTGVKKFSQVVEKNMPSEYHLIAKHHLMEIKLLIFIRERHRARVTKTEAVTEATGIGHVVGNKGAVVVKLTLDDTTFCFVCCHLAAHEGAKFLAQRNDDVIDIMRNIERDKVYGLPVMHQFNHIFWMGDLNYRLDVKHLLPVAVTWSHDEKFGYVSGLISAGRYDDLREFDELRREMAEGHVFAGFTEGKLCFAPTFKVARGKAREYQQLRVPSYCDRILWHSLSLHRNHVKLREYGSVESVDTSDHKPVYGVFELVIPNQVKIYRMPAPRNSLKCTLDFIHLRVSGLYEKRAENDETSAKYEVVDDGSVAMSPKSEMIGENEKSGGHTRRVVTATFHGNGMFLKEKAVRIEVPLRAGKRECRYEELPAIAIRPVGGMNDLIYKYTTIVFARMGSKQGSSCVLPFAKMVQMPGRHRISAELELTKYGMGIAKVAVVVELVVSLETWIDTNNNVVRARLR